jgi:hypothetical protein
MARMRGVGQFARCGRGQIVSPIQQQPAKAIHHLRRASGNAPNAAGCPIHFWHRFLPRPRNIKGSDSRVTSQSQRFHTPDRRGNQTRVL